MAGIAGIRTSGADLEGMLQRLRHRGPCETWLSLEQYVRLGCCLLPPEMMPKPRAYACQGAGSLLWAERQASSSDFIAHRQREEGLRLNSAEELYYYRIFKGSFPQPTLSRLVARWDAAKGEFRS